MSEKRKHTPGPWAPSQSNPRIVVALGGRHDIGAVCDCYGGRTREEYQANRALIAAAPELLEALEKALPFLAGELAGKVKQLIAKAKGGS